MSTVVPDLRRKDPVTHLGYGAGFWLSFGILVVVTAPLFFYKLGSWPWDHDEVAGLVEVGALEMSVPGAPATQLDRVSRLLPVWWHIQRLCLSVLPADEFGTRVLSAVCGVLIVLSGFVLGWRFQGPGFAAALAIILGMNQGLVWLSQHNRFYTPALLFLSWSFAALWWPTRRHGLAAVACVGLSVLAILCHNLLVVVYGIYFLAAVICAALGTGFRPLLMRAFLTALVTGGIYVLYLRPLLSGWVSGGTGGSNPLVSFAALVGMPTLCLALVGGSIAYSRGVSAGRYTWCVVASAGSLAFIAISVPLMGNWNPRYGILFALPVWVLAAYGVASIATTLPTVPVRVMWYIVVALLLLPKLASHWQDGSRHDLRAAAAVAARHLESRDVVLCNWPMEMSYYLRGHSSAPVVGWVKGEKLPDQTCLVVYASNAFEPAIRPDGRACELVAEFRPRRFDEQSHIVCIYRVGPIGSGIVRHPHDPPR